MMSACPSRKFVNLRQSNGNKHRHIFMENLKPTSKSIIIETLYENKLTLAYLTNLDYLKLLKFKFSSLILQFAKLIKCILQNSYLDVCSKRHLNI